MLLISFELHLEFLNDEVNFTQFSMYRSKKKIGNCILVLYCQRHFQNENHIRESIFFGFTLVHAMFLHKNPRCCRRIV